MRSLSRMDTRIKKILFSPWRWLLVLVGSFVVFILFGVLSNIPAVKVQNAILGNTTFISKLFEHVRTALAIKINYLPLGLFTAIALSLLTAINIFLVVVYIKYHKSQKSKVQLGSGVAGFVAGLFGIGCAACGAALAGPLASLIGVGFLSSLPLHGQEIGLLGIVISLISIISMIRHLTKPPVCEVEITGAEMNEERAV